MRPKKIILISIDALRADHLGCYGYRRNTSPNIDRLRREFFLFRWAFSACSYTVPSHASMLTGKYPSNHTFGFLQDWKPTYNPNKEIMLQEVLSSMGYETAAFVSGFPMRKGTGLSNGFKLYDEGFTQSELNRREELLREGSETNRRVFDWLDVNAPKEFFLFVHYFDVHGPYSNPEGFSETFVGDNLYSHATYLEMESDENPVGGIPAYQVLKPVRNQEGALISYEKDARYYVAEYDAGIRYIDFIVGQLNGKLKQLGIYNDCLIVITSDHGEAMGENNVWFYHGITVTPDQIRVPLILKPYTGWKVQPRKIETHVSLVDLFPTICDLTRFDRGKLTFDGKSLVRLLEHGADDELESRTIMAEIQGQVAHIDRRKIEIKAKKVDKDKPTFIYVEELCKQERKMEYRTEGSILEWRGEKHVPGKEPCEIHYEHLHRYRFAKEFVKGKKVLDLACGEGYGSFILAEEAEEVIGIDIDETTIRHASSKYIKENIKFIKGSITDIPIEGEKMFDVAVWFKALEDIEKHDELMGEVKRILKADGIFIVSTPNHYIYPDQGNYQNPYHLEELYFDEFKNLLSSHFQHVYIFGQKVYSASNIFALSNELGPRKDFTIERGDKEFVFTTTKKKPSEYFIAIASDQCMDKNLALGDSYLIDLSDTLFRDRDAQISHLETLVREKGQQLSRLERVIRDERAALNGIYDSHGWKALSIFYKLIAKILPMNTKRRLFAMVLFKSITEPRTVSKIFHITDLKKYFYIFRNAEPAVMEKEIKKKISRVSHIDEVPGVVKKFDNQYEEVFESTRRTMSTRLERVEEAGKKSDVCALMNDIRLVAFYLPQYHPIPENDRWWGKGFTDWTNVVKAVPNFEGHYQPHLPADLGFYDLRVAEVREQQAEMARESGIYGFCYHHYWFNGRRLLERPFNEVLKTGRPDFPFCLCWANENWTRRWDGAEHEILIAQSHSKEDDIAFIRDIIPAFRDGRYIRVNGKPLLIVYRVSLLPNPGATADIWRAECKAAGLGEIYLCAAQSFGITDPRPYGFDAAAEFPPHGVGSFVAEISEEVQLTNPGFTGNIFIYEDVVHFERKKKRPRYTLFRTVMPSWDNTPRKQNASDIFVHATPDLYKEWLAHVIEYTHKNLFGGERLVFINAWNEWAEGAHLEPDRKYGDKFLKATKGVMEKFQSNSSITDSICDSR